MHENTLLVDTLYKHRSASLAFAVFFILQSVQLEWPGQDIGSLDTVLVTYCVDNSTFAFNEQWMC